MSLKDQKHERSAWRYYPYLRTVVLTAVLIVGTGAGIWWWLAHRSPINEGNVALKQAYRLQRPLEERISGFNYAPLFQSRGGNLTEIDSIALARAERLLHDAAYNDPNPIALHALGRYYLAQKKFKQASEQFARALQAAPRQASLHNDQSVALMEQSFAASGEAESGEEVEQLAIALEHSNQSLEIDPDLLEAIFNRALIYQRLMLPQRAREEWQRYLKQDATSPWADEARRNLQKIKELQPKAAQAPAQLLLELSQARQQGDDERVWSLISQNRDRIGSIVTGELLDRYLAALTKGDRTEATQLEDLALFAGAREMRMSGDRFTSDQVSFYSRMTPIRLAKALKARNWLKLGIEQLDQAKKTEEVAGLFSQATQLFRQIGNNGGALQAELLFAGCLQKQAELKTRSDLYERVSKVAEQSRYHWLLIRSFYEQASLQSSLGNDSNVIEYSQKGLQVAQASNDLSLQDTFLLQAAEAYYNLGEYHQSIKLYREGMALLNLRQPELRSAWRLCMSIAFPLNSLGRHAAAVEYQRESLRVAYLINNPRQISLSYINLGLTYGFLRRYQEATRNAEQAVNAANSIADEILRAKHLALTTLKLGQLYNQAGDFAKAAEVFDQAIRLYEGLDSQQAFEYTAHKGKLIAALARGETWSLEEEINTVLKLFDKYRVKIREESNRNKFFDIEQNIYDIAIDFWHARKRDTQAAFELAERCRARSLLDLVTSGPQTIQDATATNSDHDQVSPPMTLAEIQSRMPDQAQIVQYAVLKDRLLIWVISSSKPIEVREQKISSDELTRLVSSYLQLVTKMPASGQSAATDAALTESAQRLYGLLIGPIESLLDRQKTICLSPDKILNQLPYGALVVPGSDRFLVEDYSLIFAPSATMFVICSETAAAKEKVGTDRILSIGDPAFDRKTFALPYLPSARWEAEAVAAYYTQSRVLTGAQATKQFLENEIERFDILHLALHCIVDEHSPMRSKLLLAKLESDRDEAGEADEVLQAYEIYRLRLSRLKLVVLAACRSGIERYYGGEGMMGISRPFIAKGVPMVVASLWEVYSPSTSELMTRFHQYRKLKNLPTPEALRQAQLNLLRNSDAAYRHPYYWAAFESIGGYTSF